jgi:hypothetical protein
MMPIPEPSSSANMTALSNLMIQREYSKAVECFNSLPIENWTTPSDTDTRTAAHIAAEFLNFQIVKLYTEKSPNVSTWHQPDITGQTPLLISCASSLLTWIERPRRFQIIDCLSKPPEARPYLLTCNKWNRGIPLHIAVQNAYRSDPSVMLLAHRTPLSGLSMQNSTGQSAEEIARAKGMLDVVAVIQGRIAFSLLAKGLATSPQKDATVFPLERAARNSLFERRLFDKEGPIAEFLFHPEPSPIPDELPD